MKLSKTVENKISSLLDENSYKGYELQIDKLLDILGLSLYAAKFTDNKLSGCIYKDELTEKFNIYVNASHPMTRKRFTIAHEIGHYISAICNSFSREQLYKGNGFEDHAISYRKSGESSNAETEANEIAARLLMPENYVDKLLEYGLGIEQMAEKFYVSQQAISIRIDRLGISVL